MGGGRAIANKFARQLRRNATPAERKLWQALRPLKSEGFHFRRQVPLAGYIADFACHRARLVIELDGGQHNEGDAPTTDAARTKVLRRHGYAVLRFWNRDVLKNSPAAPVADDDPRPAAFGDFRQGYLIIDRVGVRILRDPYSSKPYVLFYTVKRVGGGVQNFEAIKLLKFGTA